MRPVVVATDMSPIYVSAEIKGKRRTSKQRNCCRESHGRTCCSWTSPTPNIVPVRETLLKMLSVTKEPMDCVTVIHFNFTLFVIGDENPRERKSVFIHHTLMWTIRITEVTRRSIQWPADSCMCAVQRPGVPFSYPTYPDDGPRLQAEYTLKGGRNVRALGVSYPCQTLRSWNMEKADTVSLRPSPLPG